MHRCPAAENAPLRAPSYPSSLDRFEAFADKLSTCHAGEDWETDMKLGITMFAALALIAFHRVAAAEQATQNLVIKIVDQVGTYPPQWPIRPRHRLAIRLLYGAYPACVRGGHFSAQSALCG